MMNKKIGIGLILFIAYLLINSLHDKDLVFSIYYFIGILMLVLAIIWEIRRSEMYQQTENIQRPIINFVFSYAILGSNIDNLIKYFNSEDILLKILYVEGVLAFGILCIYEYVRFFGKRTKKSSKLLVGIIVGIEIVKLLIVFIF